MDCRNCSNYSFKGENVKGYCSKYGAYYYVDEGRNCNYNTESVDSYDESSGGCYIATCVYGSYDCPEVWTLRRYRDYYLANSLLGRAFIKAYYALSPSVVNIFGNSKLFKNYWKKILDKKIRRLQNIGVESTPYKDEEK